MYVTLKEVLFKTTHISLTYSDLTRNQNMPLLVIILDK